MLPCQALFTPKPNICTSELIIGYLCEMGILHLPQTHYFLLQMYPCQRQMNSVKITIGLSAQAKELHVTITIMSWTLAMVFQSFKSYLCLVQNFTSTFPFHLPFYTSFKNLRVFVVVHSLNHVQLLVNPWNAAYQASLCFTISQSFLKFMSIESYAN